MSRPGDWLQTYSGSQFWPLDPIPEEIKIEDIAHALANQCRFAGHCKKFYSVAEHSVRVSHIPIRHYDQLWGLLHDASEAYIVYIPRPVKRLPLMRPYLDLERSVQEAICARFALDLRQPDSVTQADNILLSTEARDLMWPLHPGWEAGLFEKFPPLPDVIVPWSPEEAEKAFLFRFAELD